MANVPRSEQKFTGSTHPGLILPTNWSDGGGWQFVAENKNGSCSAGDVCHLYQSGDDNQIKVSHAITSSGSNSFATDARYKAFCVAVSDLAANEVGNFMWVGRSLANVSGVVAVGDVLRLSGANHGRFVKAAYATDRGKCFAIATTSTTDAGPTVVDVLICPGRI